MALANTFTFSVTASDLIQHAMFNIGALGESETPTTAENTDCLWKLQALVKQWMGAQDFAPGLKQWTRARGDLFLSSSKGVYQLGPTGDSWAGALTGNDPSVVSQQNVTSAASASGATTLTFASTTGMTVADFLVVQLSSGDIQATSIGSINSGVVTLGNGNTLKASVASGAYVWNYTQKAQRPLAIITAVLRDSQANDIPLNVMTLQDYEMLPTKTSTTYLTDPTAYYYESQIGSQLTSPSISGSGMLYLDCGAAQDITKHLHIVYLRPTMDFTDTTSNPEYPQQWYRALTWGLAKEIAPMFDAQWTEVMESNFKDALAMARQADPETTSLYFAPNADLP